MKFVSAQFIRKGGDKSNPEDYEGRAYTYETEGEKLEVGDLVRVNGKNGPSVVCVNAIDLPTPPFKCQTVIEKYVPPAPEPGTEEE